MKKHRISRIVLKKDWKRKTIFTEKWYTKVLGNSSTKSTSNLILLQQECLIIMLIL